MALDIGLDLGTSTIVAGSVRDGIVLREPAIIAVDSRTDKVLHIGGNVQDMLGKEPDHIRIVRPLRNGVISDYNMTGILIKHFIRQVSQNQLIKPRVIVCVPSGITQVEAQSVISATEEAGARRVVLIEEPVAAAIGAGLDISKPLGKMVVDIGGGSSDTAVLSMNGIVSKSSVRVAGNAFDVAIQRYMRANHNILIGINTAEKIKVEIGSVWEGSPELCGMVRGRDYVTGLPQKKPINRSDLVPVLQNVALEISTCIQKALEVTQPELVADIHTSELLITGGGGLIDGLAEFFNNKLRLPSIVAEDALNCAALGTIKAFEYLDQDFNGFYEPNSYLSTY